MSYKEISIVLMLYLLFTAFIGFHSYGYYELLKWLVPAYGIYTIVTIENMHKLLRYVNIGLVLLFNPWAYHSRDTWFFIDIIAAAIVFADCMHQGEKQKRT